MRELNMSEEIHERIWDDQGRCDSMQMTLGDFIQYFRDAGVSDLDYIEIASDGEPVYIIAYPED
jgi:hypothetical protein